jgi:hypothetical protein
MPSQNGSFGKIWMRLFKVKEILFLLVALLAGGELGCSARSSWSLQPSGRLDHPDVIESSGVVASRVHTGVLWTHNDDGLPQLFAAKESGRLIRTYRLPGVQNRDWEDIALDSAGNLYLFDNTARLNDDNRSFLLVLREPDPFSDKRVAEVVRIPVLFPEAELDTEAIFVWDGKVYFVTKPWDASRPHIYRLDDLDHGGELEYVGKVPVNAMITGGDIHPNGHLIALSSYRALFIFEGLEEPGRMLQKQPEVSPLNAGQIEGVSWLGENLVLTNEQREVFRISEEFWRDNQAPFLRTTAEEIPSVVPLPKDPLALSEKGRTLWVEAPGRPNRFGKLAWSPMGLHLMVFLPAKLQLGKLDPEEGPRNLSHWFMPGLIYVLLNPDGERPLRYGPEDRCVVIGLDDFGEISTRAVKLGPATVVEEADSDPDWLQVDQKGRSVRILVKPGAPGFGDLEEGRRIGFNILATGPNSTLYTWTPLTMQYSFDSPSVWGLLELKR